MSDGLQPSASAGRAPVALMGAVFLAVAALSAGITYLISKDSGSASAGPASAPVNIQSSNTAGAPAVAAGGNPAQQPVSPRTTAGGPSTDPNQIARDELDRIVFFDRPTVDTLVDRWVPQISAKRPGIEDDGIVYQLPDIVRKHHDLQRDFGAVLLRSGEFVFSANDLFVSVIPQGFATPDEALAVCVERSLGKKDCFARLLTHNRSIRAKDTVKMQP